MTETRPFSNGTEGEAWRSLWCGFCTHDHATHDPDDPRFENGCEHLLNAVIGQPVEPWTMAPEGWRHLPALMTCSQFAVCGCGDGGETAVEFRSQASAAVAAAGGPS